MQGATVHKPSTANIETKSFKEGGQGFVAFSRVQELDQLFIIEKFEPDKVYADEKALLEISRMNAR